MGQILHGSATTTYIIQAAIQRSKAPLKELAAQHGLNQKIIAKWRKRAFVHDAPIGPKNARSTVLTTEQEAMVVTFRKHTLLPMDDRLYALQATISQLTRSSLHRFFQRHGLSRPPEVAGDKSAKQPCKRDPIGYFHIDIAGVRTEEGKAVAPPEVTMNDIYMSVIPYVLVTFVGVLIIIIFPEIALYFPNLFFGEAK